MGVLCALWVVLLGSDNGSRILPIAYGAEVVVLSSCALSLPSLSDVSWLQVSFGLHAWWFHWLVVSIVV